MRIGPVGFTIFLLFFGGALLDAIAMHHWWRSIFWIAIGIVFVLADNLRTSGQTK